MKLEKGGKRKVLRQKEKCYATGLRVYTARARDSQAKLSLLLDLTAMITFIYLWEGRRVRHTQGIHDVEIR